MSQALFGVPRTLEAQGKLPLLPPPVGGTGSTKVNHLFLQCMGQSIAILASFPGY